MMREREPNLTGDPVLRACLFCRTPLPRNRQLSQLPSGRRIAFDAERGRLWLICEACDAWNLAPLDTRWEALEELAWMTSHKSRVLSRTANITLHQLGALQIVRVGLSSLRETVWWRYGEVLRQRRRRAQDARTWGKIINAATSALIVGVPLPNWRDANWNVERARRKLYGRHAWQEPLQCARCGTVQPGLRYEQRGSLRLGRAEGGAVLLWTHCARCGRAAHGAGFTLAGAAAELTLGRALAHHHFAGASDGMLERAATAVGNAGSGAALTRQLADQHTFLARLQPHQLLALEIAVNEHRETSLLALQANALEARWREEERIAAIADGELS